MKKSKKSTVSEEKMVLVLALALALVLVLVLVPVVEESSLGACY